MLKSVVSMEICTRNRAPQTLLRVQVDADVDELERLGAATSEAARDQADAMVAEMRAEAVEGYRQLAEAMGADLYVDGVRA